MGYLGNSPENQSFTPAIDYFSGNGSAVAFTLSRPVISAAQIQVVVENVPQAPGDAFSVSGSTLTFTSAPPSGSSNIYVYYVTINSQVVGISQGTIGVTQLSATGTPSSTTFLRGDNTWASAAGFPSGTVMLFAQTSAPTGWTKNTTTGNNSALRVVTGTASTGGSVAFTTAFASGLSAGATTLSTTQIPSHSHTMTIRPGCVTGGAASSPGDGSLLSTGATGGGGSHTHTIPSLDVLYIDVIRATRD
jgi:hypothetical protein